MSRMDRFNKPAGETPKKPTGTAASGVSPVPSEPVVPVPPNPMEAEKLAIKQHYEDRLERADDYLKLDPVAFMIGREDVAQLINDLIEDTQRELLSDVQHSHSAERAQKLMRMHDEVFRKVTLVNLATSSGVKDAAKKPLSDIVRLLSNELDDDAKKTVELELHRTTLYTDEGKKEIARLAALLAEPKKHAIPPPPPTAPRVDATAPTLTPIPEAPRPTGPPKLATASIGQILAHHSVIVPFASWVKDKSEDVLNKVLTDITHATYEGADDPKVQKALVAAINDELRGREQSLKTQDEKVTMDTPIPVPPAPAATPAPAPTPAPQPTPAPAPPAPQASATPDPSGPPKRKGPKMPPGEATMLERKIAPPWYRDPMKLGLGAVLLVICLFIGWKIAESYSRRPPPVATTDPVAPTVPETTLVAADFTCIAASAHGDCSAISLVENTITLTEDRRAVAHWDCSGVNRAVLWEHMDGPALNGCDLCRWCEPRTSDD